MKTLKILLIATFMFGIAPFITPVVNVGSAQAGLAVVGECGSVRLIRGKIEDEMKSKPVLGGVEDGAFRLIHISRDKSRYAITLTKDGEMCVIAKGNLTFVNKRVLKSLLGN